MKLLIHSSVRAGHTAKPGRGARVKKRSKTSGLAVVKTALGQLLGWGENFCRALPAAWHWSSRHRAWLAMGLGGVIMIAVSANRDELLSRYFDHPVEYVEIKGRLTFLDEHSLRAKLSDLIGRGFFSLDLYRLKTEIESMSWVEKASIRRVWPNKLEYRIVEQVPVASWNEKALLNLYGHVFQPAESASLARAKRILPALSGPDNQAKSVLVRYAELRKKVAEHHIRLHAVSLERRGAWALMIDSGIRVELGKERIDERVDRLIAVYSRLIAKRRAKIDKIDTRYTNGVAISWLEGATKSRDTGKS